MSTKPSILFLARARLDVLYLETIKELRKKYTVVVICAEDSINSYKDLEGIIVVGSSYLYTESDNADLNRISDVEKKLGLDCYASNINYFLYRKFAGHYGVDQMHKSENERVPSVFIRAYDFLMELVDKYNIQYAFFETIDTIDSVILAAMAKVGIIRQTFERGFLSIGGEMRMRLCSEQTKISPRLNHIYEHKKFSAEDVAWAENVIGKSKAKRVISDYDRVHMKMGSTLPRKKVSEYVSKVKGIMAGKDAALPTLLKIKNRIFAKKYFTDSLPKTKVLSYFLQLTPEASLCYQIPKFADQLYMLEQVAMRGKYDYTIVVKEHPRCYGNRLPQFYKELTMLPNVILLPPSFSNREIIDKSEAVLCLGGSSPALESLINSKPVITLGHPYFDVCKNVYNVDAPEQVWNIIEAVKHDHDDQVRFFAALHAATCPHPESNSLRGLAQASGLGPVLAKFIDHEIDLYEQGVL